MRLRPTLILLALGAALAGGIAVAVALTSSPPSAEDAAATLEKNYAEAREQLVAEFGVGQPLELTLHLFEKGGHEYVYGYDPTDILGGYVAVFPERVVSRTTLTSDANGKVSGVVEEISSADGGLPTLRSLLDRSEKAGTESTLSWGEGDVLPEAERWSLGEWLDAQARGPLNKQADGYAYAGESTLNGRASFRYESRTTASMLPSGEMLDSAVELLDVIEYDVANPLRSQWSLYRVEDEETQTLESQSTVASIRVVK